jgi:hypothetical protein
MEPEGKNWRDIYEFDTPVVSNPLLQCSYNSEADFMISRSMSVALKQAKSFQSYLLRQRSSCIDSRLKK